MVLLTSLVVSTLFADKKSIICQLKKSVKTSNNRIKLIIGHTFTYSE